MGFEVAGESFPGSAFYYLADEPSAYAAAPVGGTFTLAGPNAADDAFGPAARPIANAGSAIDKARALQCMTMAIYYEAATESDAGQRAVAQVVLNRVAHPAYPNTVCGVVFQGSERSTGCQFSFTCDGSLARAPARKFWDRAQRVAMASLAGSVYRPVGLATHYHTVQIHPYWADSLNNITTIGAHTFYRWRGAAGLPAAFTQAYFGAEPLPQRHRPTATPDAASLADPLELARRYEATLVAAQPATPVATTRGAAGSNAQPAQKLPAPTYSTEIEARGGETLYSGNRLPGGGEVKSQYSQSGQWIGRP
ncbi:cell wall hydrolase [Erythrobacter sp. SG61-1L]|nr:cell wall hydrolase [Erythrobacter sp. SG61-1L]